MVSSKSTARRGIAMSFVASLVVAPSGSLGSVSHDQKASPDSSTDVSQSTNEQSQQPAAAHDSREGRPVDAPKDQCRSEQDARRDDDGDCR